MANKLAACSIKGAFYPATLHHDAFHLCDGRNNLPLRVMIGRVEGQALRVTKLLNYASHVAVLGLVSAQIHQHVAALMVVTKNAGAFQGTLDQFEAWRAKAKLKQDGILATKLPDGVDWVVWSRSRKLETDIIPMVNGWDGLNFTDLECSLGASRLNHAIIH